MAAWKRMEGDADDIVVAEVRQHDYEPFAAVVITSADDRLALFRGNKRHRRLHLPLISLGYNRAEDRTPESHVLTDVTREFAVSASEPDVFFFNRASRIEGTLSSSQRYHSGRLVLGFAVEFNEVAADISLPAAGQDVRRIYWPTLDQVREVIKADQGHTRARLFRDINTYEAVKAYIKESTIIDDNK